MEIPHSLTLPIPLDNKGEITHSNTTKTVSFVNESLPRFKDNKHSSSYSSTDESGVLNLISRKKSNLGNIWRGSIGRNKTLKKLLDTKTVGFAGGVTLLINGILGPGLIPTPELYSESGFLIPSLVFIFFTIISTLCATFIIEAMQSIPGNRHFQGTVEFSTLINFYFGKKMHFIGQIILFLAIQSTNISSIIYSAQTMDNFIINIFKKSCGVAFNYQNLFNNTLTENDISLHCVDKLAEENSPFGDQYMLITLGFIITFVCIFPIGFIKLQDNINLQIISFSITIAIFILWIVLFIIHGVDPSLVNIIGENQSQVVGVVMFNFAFITTIPSWINIKKKEVSVQKSLWTSTITAVLLYIIIGHTAAITFESKGTLNLLSQVGSINLLGRITTYIFSVAILMVSIPVFSIIVRNNLVQNKICGYKTATFFSHVFPWICVLPFQTGNLINIVINWTSLLFVSTANFIIPLVIYLRCLDFNKKYLKDKYLTLRQRQILKCVHWSSNTIQGFIDEYPLEEKISKPVKTFSDESLYDKKEIIKNDKYPEVTINSDENLETSNSSSSNSDGENTLKSTFLSPNIILTDHNDNTPSRNVSFSNSHSQLNKDIDEDTNIKKHYTLPTHPLFISNVFEGIPSWVPFKPVNIARVSLGLVIIVTVGVIGLNIYQLLQE